MMILLFTLLLCACSTSSYKCDSTEVNCRGGGSTPSVEPSEPADTSTDEPSEPGTSEPSESDRAGTRSNMLGPKVLDAQQHPYLRAAVTVIAPDQALVDLRVRDHVHQQQVPVEAQITDGSATISARFSATHAQLGLTPFSVLGGAIAVADPIEIELELTAVQVNAQEAP